jgi:transaldolase
MPGLDSLKIKIFADGADVASIKKLYAQGIVKGFTTNPTLMRKACVSDYETFARAVLEEITDLPVSFEVLSDEFNVMEAEARKIAGWGKNVNIKIPITNTRGESSIPLVKKLAGDGVNLNITAILTVPQVEAVSRVLCRGVKSIVSVFAGRIADTGRDPVPCMKKACEILSANSDAELLWASTREVLNICQAAECGCHIITVTSDILQKLKMLEKNLDELSLETVKMFYNDAQHAGYKI